MLRAPTLRNFPVLREFPKRYRRLLSGYPLFNFGNSSNSIIIPRTHHSGVSLAPLIYSRLNLIAAPISYPVETLPAALAERISSRLSCPPATIATKPLAN
jgi:hypothetical protein